MKNFLSSVFLSILAVLAPIQAVIYSIMVLIVFDLITGVIAARKRCEPITASMLSRSIYKFLMYEMTVISAFLVQHYLTAGQVPCVKIVAGIIGATELKSILENAEVISEEDLLKRFVDILSSKKNEPEA